MRSRRVAMAVVALLVTGVVASVVTRAPPRQPTAAATTEISLQPVVFRTPGGLLQVASVRSTEVLERRSTLRIAGLNLGTTVSQIKVPATFSYQAELGGEWQAHESGGRLLIIAPKYHPALPVAIDTRHIEMQTRRGWARFDARDNEEALLRDVTAELDAKANSPGYMEAHREQARRTMTEFVPKWFITQERWKAVKPGQVRVYFADEPIERLRASEPEAAGSP